MNTLSQNTLLDLYSMKRFLLWTISGNLIGHIYWVTEWISVVYTFDADICRTGFQTAAFKVFLEGRWRKEVWF